MLRHDGNVAKPVCLPIAFKETFLPLTPVVLETYMRSWTKICILSGLILAVISGYAQSLPEVARQQRLRQQARDIQASKKVVTNDDIPSRPETVRDSEATLNEEDEAPVVSAKSKKTAEQWKQQILAQENVVSSLERDVTRLGASVHFVEVNRYSNGVQYNQYQARKQEEVIRLQKQLDAEKKKLADMQESARRAGFGSAVYEP
jgi:hypothetical protein